MKAKKGKGPVLQNPAESANSFILTPALWRNSLLSSPAQRGIWPVLPEVVMRYFGLLLLLLCSPSVAETPGSPEILIRSKWLRSLFPR